MLDRLSRGTTFTSEVSALSRGNVQLSDPRIQNSSSTTFSSGIITQPTNPVSGSPPGDWRSPTAKEIKEALGNADSLFRKHLATSPGAQRWLENLAERLQEKSTSMTPEHQGFELYMRFKAAYSDIHHLAYGTIWRDSAGALRAAFLHQESVPPRPPDLTINTGRILDHFDTSGMMRDGHAPVDQSMRLVGMPDVNLYAAEQPAHLEGITSFLNHPEAIHPYGLFKNYGDRLPNAPDIQHVNCFAITEMASNAVHGEYFEFPKEDPMPGSCKRQCEFASTDWNKHFNAIKLKGQTYFTEKVNTYERGIGIGLAMHVGRYWGEDRPWDVASPHELRKGTLRANPGEGLQIPADAIAIKFIGGAKNITLDGNQVGRQTYTAEEARRMKNGGATPVAPKFLYGVANDVSVKAKL